MSSEQRKTRSHHGKTAGNYSHDKRRQADRSPGSSLAKNSESLQLIGQQLNGIYIVVAQIQSPGPVKRYRRRFYANLPSAQRALDRAVMQGRDAQLFIGRVHIVSGDVDG